jgi:predicted 3-demethylubiquinone-9 3-methyltransferase (glyoxalase superfamily)
MKLKLKMLTFSLIIAVTGFSQSNNNSKGNEGQSAFTNKNNHMMNQKIITSLTFQKNDAEHAMNFYVSLFDNSKIIDIHRWGPNGPGKEGTIMQATFDLNGRRFMCSDSPPVHNWDFSPAIAIYVECESEAEIEMLFTKLSENGAVAMPLDNYGFSQKFSWITDRYGVSWQLNLQ